MAKALILKEVEKAIKTMVPLNGQRSNGYGAKIPTAYMLKVEGKWRRVYAINYANAGNTYVVLNGENHYLESDVEHLLEQL